MQKIAKSEKIGFAPQQLGIRLSMEGRDNRSQLHGLAPHALERIRELIETPGGLDRADKALADVCLAVLDRCGLSPAAAVTTGRRRALSLDDLAAERDAIEALLLAAARDMGTLSAPLDAPKDDKSLIFNPFS